LWGHTRQAIVRLDRNGVVDRILGSDPKSNSPLRVASIAVDIEGRICASDENASAIHVFSADGKHQFTCAASAEDLAGRGAPEPLIPIIGNHGQIYCELPRREGADDDSPSDVIEFSGDGKQTCTWAIRGDRWPGRAAWAPATNDGEYWSIGSDSVDLRDRSGRVLQKVTRTVGREWLYRIVYSITASADGSIVVNDGNIHIFDSHGRPTGIIKIPETVSSEFAYGPPTSFDGNRLAVAGDGIVLIAKRDGTLTGVFEPGGPHQRFPRLFPFLVHPRATGRVELWIYAPDIDERAIERYALD
jgi:hypothetical protein